MKALKIKKELKDTLIKNSIVICTYIDVDGNLVDCISIEYKDKYPDLEEVVVYPSQEQYEIINAINSNISKLKEDIKKDLANIQETVNKIKPVI